MKKGDLIRTKNGGLYGLVFDHPAGGSVFVLRSDGLLTMCGEGAWENVVHENGGMVGQPVNFGELVESKLALDRILVVCESAHLRR